MKVEIEIPETKLREAVEQAMKNGYNWQHVLRDKILRVTAEKAAELPVDEIVSSFIKEKLEAILDDVVYKQVRHVVKLAVNKELAVAREARRWPLLSAASRPTTRPPARSRRCSLLVGITGPSFSGKSYSAEELAAGMQKVYGGQIYHIDTENDRALELHKRYGGKFEFQHVPFRQPASPEQYAQVIRYCLAKPDCGVIIVDTMTHEHIALLNMMEEYLDRKGAGDDWQKRDRMLFASMVVPKAQRKHLNELVAFGCVRPDGRKVPVILLYRAQDKTKPGKSKADGGDGKPIHKGWQAETTSDLPFYMTARFLLPPGSDGHPNLNPDTEWERLAIKNPQQFRGWFKEGFQLTEEIGEKLARWAKGEQAQAQLSGAAEKPTSGPPADVLKEALSLLVGRLPGPENQEQRAGLFESAFGTRSSSTARKMPQDQQAIALAELRRQLDGLAAMKRETAPAPEQWLQSASDQEDQQALKAQLFDLPAREPGED